MGLRLISATPSPFPWDSTTQTPTYNPLEKLPVLVDDSTNPATSVYESHFILEWLETKYPAPVYPAMLSTDVNEKLFAKQVEVLCDGMCDALVLLFFEKQRSEEARSKEWMERQMRKVEGGLRALSQWVGDERKDFLVGGSFSLADVAAGSVLGYMKVRFADHRWQEQHPNLKMYSNRLEERQSFQDTVPKPQTIKDKAV